MSVKKNENGPTDWGWIFDLIASEYGYSLEQFGRMTFRQIDIALRNIDRRKRTDFAARAALHGIRIEIQEELPKMEPTEKQKAEIDRLSKMSIAERRKAILES